MAPFQRILVATDFSSVSEAAFEEAARIAREAGARLYVLHAYDGRLPGSVSYVPASVYVESLAAARLAAEATLRDLLARESMRGLDARMLVRKGPAEDEIIDAAERENVDLIVMGTHARHGAAKLILGSVAERVIATARCPVLTVRAPHAKTAGLASSAA